MPSEGKYARREWERRFLLEGLPSEFAVTAVRGIVDRYIVGTTLRLRQQISREGQTVYKLTQKLPGGRSGSLQGLITTMYITQREFEIFAALPSMQLIKTRYSVPPLGIDVFEGTLCGLVLAEAEFNSGEEASSLAPPAFAVREVTADRRFNGGSLAAASREEVAAWLAEDGLKLNPL